MAESPLQDKLNQFHAGAAEVTKEGIEKLQVWERIKLGINPLFSSLNLFREAFGLDSKEDLFAGLLEGMFAQMFGEEGKDVTGEMAETISALRIKFPVVKELHSFLIIAAVFTQYTVGVLAAPNQLLQKKFREKLKPTEGSIADLYRFMHITGGQTVPTELAKFLGYSDEWLKIFDQTMQSYPDVGTLITLLHREELNDEGFVGGMRKIGINSDNAKMILDAGRVPLGVAEVVSLWRRGQITSKQSTTELFHLGYTGKDIRRAQLLATPLPDFETVRRLSHYGRLDAEQYEQKLKELGYGLVPDKLDPDRGKAEDSGLTEEQATKNLEDIKSLQYEPLAMGQLLVLKFRKIITEEEFKTEAGKLGVSPDMLGKFLEGSTLLAPPTDLMRFAVKGAYNQAEVDQFQLDEDFPESIMPDAEAIGYKREVVTKYWRAHWNLPAPGQVIEAFQRGVVDEATLDLYLKAADFSKFWRGMIKKIQYERVPRRVISRLYRQGLVSSREVNTLFTDLGFSPTAARVFTKSVEADAHIEEKEISKGEILSGYRSGTLSESATRSLLKGLDFSQSAINFLIDLTELKIDRDRNSRLAKRAKRQEDEARDKGKAAVLKAYRDGQIQRYQASIYLERMGIVRSAVNFLLDAEDFKLVDDFVTSAEKQIKRQFDNHIIDYDVAVSNLVGFGMDNTKATNRAEVWRLERLTDDVLSEQQDDKPTKSELRRWLRKELIGAAEFTEQMQAIGTPDRLIQLHLDDLATSAEG
tara:strand:- start:2671 stop:4935 length:2265 start_codon:yes stop_codon:yes gene_type:complete